MSKGRLGIAIVSHDGFTPVNAVFIARDAEIALRVIAIGLGGE